MVSDKERGEKIKTFSIKWHFENHGQKPIRMNIGGFQLPVERSK